MCMYGAWTEPIRECKWENNSVRSAYAGNIHSGALSKSRPSLSENPDARRPRRSPQSRRSKPNFPWNARRAARRPIQINFNTSPISVTLLLETA
jgi:hypothetical protein